MAVIAILDLKKDVSSTEVIGYQVSRFKHITDFTKISESLLIRPEIQPKKIVEELNPT